MCAVCPHGSQYTVHWLIQPSEQSKCRCVCVYDGAHNHPSVQFCFFHQGVNRAGKGAQLGRNGVRRKDWHDYEAIKRDASRSGLSKSLFTTPEKMKLNEERCFWICTHTHTHPEHCSPGIQQGCKSVLWIHYWCHKYCLYLLQSSLIGFNFLFRENSFYTLSVN